jgi:hypothetical protein
MERQEIQKELKWGDVQKRGHLEEGDGDGRIILRRILEIYIENMRGWWNWFRIV